MSDRDPDSGAKASGVVKASELNAALDTLDHIIEEQQDIEDEPEIDPEEVPETPQGVPILADVVVPGDLSLIEDEEPIPIFRLPRLEDVRGSAGDAATAGQEVPPAELCRKLIDELESIIDTGLKRATEEARVSILREVRSQVEAALQGHGAPSAPAAPQFATRSAGVPADEGFRLHLLPEGTVHVDSATPDSGRADELARDVREALNSMRRASADDMDPVPVAPVSTQSVSEIQEPQTSMSEPTPATRGAEDTTPAAAALSKTYEPHAIEQRWYETWEQQGYFQPAGQARPYCIMLPPPNVTGTLHMGHAFQDTLMDALIRYHRMQGQSTLWQGGTDHAGIATQMVVERQLLEQGTRRTDLGREAFVEAVWKWTSVSGGAITRQLRRIGTSIDWSRQRFTLDEGLSRAVTEVFVRLYHDGLIYRGKRLVNWDPVLHTAISDLEVVSQEEQGHIWHIRYPLADGPGHVVVATTRPETLLGDTAVAVHPDDERYRHLVGQQVMLPLAGRAIPIVADAHVDPTFGSGCLKITPAHDFNDYAVAQRHNLPLVNIFTPDASIGPEAPAPYVGLDRMTARKRVVADLEAQGLLEKVESKTIMVPRGDRSHAIIEPYLTDQWFVRAAPLAAPAIEAVEQGHIRFVPENWSRTYFEWMRNIQDWCISRQLWWGHRIPAWYDQHQRVFVGRSETEVRAREGLGPDVDLRQDTDVLDTWFSSALWPFSTLGWPETTPVLKTFYPTSVLVTGFDIIFFWVARMIMMGLRFTGQVPFREVYIHGLVRDQDGQKMSKSKGNIIDPIDLIDGIDLETLVGKRTTGLMRPQDAPKIDAATRKQFPDGIAGYGADALRVTFAALASPGRDINFDLGRIEGYRNFCNKLWNAARYVLMTCTANGSLVEGGAVQLGLAERWILSRLQQAVGEVTESFAEYRFDLATKAIYSFVWDEYCDWYVELSKTVLNDPQAPAAAKRGTRQVLVGVLEALLRLAHPIMPFITEEIWQRVAPLAGTAGETIMLQPFPQRDAALADDTASREIEWVKSFVLGVRRVRAEMNISPGKPLAVLVRGGTAAERTWLANYGRYLLGLTRATSIRELQDETAPDAATALAGNMTLLIPLADLIDPAAEFQRLSKEVERIRADRQRLEAKLQNQNFVERAPAEVVAKERARYVDLGTALARLEEQLGRIAALRSS